MGGLLLLVAAVSCGGNSSSKVSSPDGTTAVAGATAQQETSSLLDLERYHYVAALTMKGKGTDGKATEVLVSTEGDFQSPDRHSFTYRTQVQGVSSTRSAVVIGDKIWLRDGQNTWQSAAPTDTQARQLFATAFSPIRPNFLGGSEWRQVRESVRSLGSTVEFVNDVRALHYRVGPAGQQYFRSFLADQQFLQDVQDLQWDLWLAEDGDWPVRLLANGTVAADLQILHDLGLQAPTTWELRIDISRPNDPQLAVTAPG